MAMTKAARQVRIKEIIENHVIETQEDLGEMLRRHNIKVTQATVSRDIKELMLVKVPVGNGRSRYAFPTENNACFSQERMIRMFRDVVTGFDYSENLIIIKTLPGTANAVASAIDGARWPEVMGTIAGDDNILVVVKPKSAVERVVKHLAAMTD